MNRSMIPLFILRTAIGVSLCAVIVAWSVGPAFAAQVSTHSTASHGHTTSIYKGTKIKGAGTNLVYQGGAVETTPVVYISWWGTQCPGPDLHHELLQQCRRQFLG